MLCLKKGIKLEEKCNELGCRFLPACMNEIILDLSNLDLKERETTEKFNIISHVEDEEDYEESEYEDIDEDVVYGEEFEYTDEEE